MNRQNIKLISNLLLLLTALIWGIAFVAQSVGMDHVGPWTFVFFRYVLSSLVLIPVSVIVGRKIAKGKQSDVRSAESFDVDDWVQKREAAGQAIRGETAGASSSSKYNERSIKEYIKGGVLCGFFLGTASIAQQVGIQYTTAGKAGFITALYVIIVPILGLIIGRRPEKKIWICVVLGLVGLYLISVKEGFSIGSGDAMVMLCALLFSCQIMCVDHFSSKLENVVLLSNIQFVVVAVIGGIGMLIFEHPVMENILAAALPILYAGILSGAVGYTLQIIAQKNTEPAVASLLMSLESVFSALAGWVILGQKLSAKELLGCVLVFAAVILAELPVGMLKKRKNQ